MSRFEKVGIQYARNNVQTENSIENGILEEFRIEFLEVWNGLPNKGFFVVLLVAWLAIFQFLGNSTLGFVHSPSLLKWMYEVYQPADHGLESEDQHGLIVPFLVIGLLWWKRKELLGLPHKTWLPSLVLLGIAVTMHIFGYLIQQPRISIMALFTGIYALMGLAWGPGWLRASFFPYFLFAFCIPLGTLGQPLTFRLRLIVCQLVEAVCHYIMAIDVAPSAIARPQAAGASPGRIDFCIENIMDHDFIGNRPWDLIVMNETIYYLGWLYSFFDVAWMANELYRATQPGGTFLIANTFGEISDYLIRPWIIRTYRDLFVNAGYVVKTEDTFCGKKDNVMLETLMTVFVKHADSS